MRGAFTAEHCQMCFLPDRGIRTTIYGEDECETAADSCYNGDPSGVGPELLTPLLKRPARCQMLPVIFGDAGVLRRVARHCRISFRTQILRLEEWKRTKPLTFPVVVDCGSMDEKGPKPGKVQAVCGQAAYAYIKEATAATMSGRVAAMATAPINKESLSLAEIPYPGHTEMLASLTGAKHVCMMMACDGMAVSLVTIHVPYSEGAAFAHAEANRRSNYRTHNKMRSGGSV